MRALTLLLLCGLSATADASWFGPPCAGPGLIPVTDYEAVLRVRRNEVDAGEEDSARVLRGGQLQLRPQTLHAYGVSVKDLPTVPDGEGGAWLTLDQVPGLEYRYDSCTQELLLDLRGTQRATHVLFAKAAQRPPPQPAQMPGAFLNLDLQAITGEDNSFGGLFELGAFAGAGHGGISALNHESGWLRLDSSWTVDAPQSMTQWIIGDAIGREAPGRRAVRFGGLSWGTEYALQPDVVTFPLPALRGDAALPSTVDVYVDGVLRQREQVPAGPFEMRGVPVLTGGGQMQAVVRDLLGREQVLAQPFYVAPALLRAGLSDYRLEGGWLRQNYGARSDDYGPAFAAASYRRGLSDHYTGALQADADEDRQSIGAGIATQLGGWADASLELAGSRAEAGNGGQLRMGLSRQAAGFNAGLELRAASTHYAGLGESEPPPRYALSARAGMPAPGGGSVAATLIAESPRDSEDALRVYGLNYSTRLGANWLLNSQIAHTRSGNSDWLFGAGLTWLLGGNSSASAYAQHSNGDLLARAGWQRQPPQTMGMAYQVDVEHSGAQSQSSRALGQLRLTQPIGVLSAAADVSEDQAAMRYGLQTGIAWMGRSFFVARPVLGSFAVVDTGGVEGVTIYRDHQPVARSDEHGLALVPDLLPYEVNTLGINLSDLPMDRRARVEQVSLVPYARSGSYVRFPVQSTAQERWLRLSRADGRWLPEDTQVRVLSGDSEALSGTGGRVLLRGGSGAVRLEARWKGGSCQAQVQISAGLDETESPLCVPSD